MSKSNEEIIKEYYYNPKTGFKGVEAIYQDLKEKGISKNEIKEFVAKQETGQIYTQPEKPKFIPITAKGDEEYQIDLMFYTQFKGQNKGYHIILTCIELTSRYAYAVALKDKMASTVANGFEKILKENGYKIRVVTSDNGSEFMGDFAKLLEKNKIEQHFVDPGLNKHTLGKIERFNRTLRMKLDRYMKANKTKTWYDVLDDVIENYNHTKHSKTGIKPAEAKSSDLSKIRLREELKGRDAKEEVNKFNIGDKVRTSKRNEDTFKKGDAKFSTAVYEISRLEGFKFYLKNIKTNKELTTPFKYYELLKIDEVERKEPEAKDKIERVSGSQIRKEGRFKRLQARDFKKGDEIKEIEDGKVVYKERLRPLNEKRVRKPKNLD